MVFLPTLTLGVPLDQEVGKGSLEPEMPSKFPAAAQNLKTPNRLPKTKDGSTAILLSLSIM